MPTNTADNTGFTPQSPSNPQNIVHDHYNKPKYYLDESEGGSFFANLIKGFVRWIFDSFQVIIIALAIFIVFYLFVVSPHTIDGVSMQPTLCDNDFVLADKFSPRFKPYTYGDVIVFRHDKTNDYIKRIIGMGGDKIKLEAGRVYLNGKVLEETYLPTGRKTKPTSDNLKDGQTYTVPAGQLFVMGDNRDSSLDSRQFLAIDPNGENEIKGRAVFTIWPFNRAHIFDKEQSQGENRCGK